MMKLKTFALAIVLALPMAACAPGDILSDLGGAAVAASAPASPVKQASDIKAAGDLFIIADNAGTAYMKSGKATPAQAKTALVIEAQLYKALMDGRAADKAGNNALVSAAVSEFNSNYKTLAGLIPGL